MEINRKKSKLPIIYPIIDSLLVPFSKIEDVALAIIKGKAKIIQLRSKKITSKDFLETARIIRKITADNGVVFIVNDRVDIALMTDADGVHLGQDDLPVKEARRLLGKNKIIGFSTHNLKEVLTANKLPVDYISFGPIFQTQSKEDAQIPKGLRGLAEVRKAINIPIVAIGGITESNLTSVFKEGADSAAMISEILSSADITEKIKRLNSIFSEVKK